MKRMLSAMLAALMLVTILPLASQPARAEEITFDIFCSVDPVEPAYVGEMINWVIVGASGGSGPYEFSLEVWKDGQLFSEEIWHRFNNRSYKFPSPGKYKVLARIKDNGDGGREYSQFSEEITVEASPNRITKVEPLGPTSLRITWNKVPGAMNC